MYYEPKWESAHAATTRAKEKAAYDRAMRAYLRPKEYDLLPGIGSRRAAPPVPKPEPTPLRDALIDIAYDSADLEAAQKRAREALRGN